MDQTAIVITGGDGQLGRALAVQFPDARITTRSTLDITERASIKSFDWDGVSVIINAAAYTNVDGAETEEGRRTAWSVNADGVANLAAVAAQHDAVLVHISTDYVFDGTQSPHTEDEQFAPLSSYGASKAAGDIAASLAPKHYILRTSWVIGEGKNFVRTMLELGKKNINPTVVADQTGRLTFTSEIVRTIDHLLKIEAPGGTYNVSNEGEPISWAALTRVIFKEAGLPNKVSDTTTAEYFAGKEGVAPRPFQSTLDLSKLQSTGFESRRWEDDLHEYIVKEMRK